MSHEDSLGPSTSVVVAPGYCEAPAYHGGTGDDFAAMQQLQRLLAQMGKSMQNTASKQGVEISRALSIM